MIKGKPLLSTITLTMLAQPVWASCDLSEQDGFCERAKNDWIRFATGEGRSLSEAYCFALGSLYPAEGKEDVSSTFTEFDNGSKKELFESSAEITICDLRVVRDERLEDLTAADGVTEGGGENTVTITRGMSQLTCNYKYEDKYDGVTVIERFDESQNFYSDLIHPTNPPNCGPDEMFKILQSKPMDDGNYWEVKIAHRFKTATN